MARGDRVSRQWKLLQILAFRGGRMTPFGASIHSALEKIGATLGPKAKTFLNSLNHELCARAIQNKDYSRLQEILQTLHDVIRTRRTIEVEYHSFGRDTVSRRRLNPLHLC